MLTQTVGQGAILSGEDERALHFVTRSTGSLHEHSYYKWVATMLEKVGYNPESVRFYKLAIELAPPEEETSELWRKVITGYTELNMFEDAYMALVTAPYESM